MGLSIQICNINQLCDVAFFLQNSDRLDAYYTSPDAYLVSGLDYGQVEFIKSEETVDCSEHIELKVSVSLESDLF